MNTSLDSGHLRPRTWFLCAPRHHSDFAMFESDHARIPCCANIAANILIHKIASNIYFLPTRLHSPVTCEPLSTSFYIATVWSPLGMELRPSQSKHLTLNSIHVENFFCEFSSSGLRCKSFHMIHNPVIIISSVSFQAVRCSANISTFILIGLHWMWKDLQHYALVENSQMKQICL